MIFPDTHVITGIVYRTSLTDQNVTGLGNLSAK
ncbi:MAG: hypothetical protein LMBGKNDO_01723 [Bacteroidales bacterium]|nr:hypothetical protein [Bacteroidales bacterium]